MDAAQAHLIAVAAEERVKELRYAIRFYVERGWDDLAAEYRLRLEEIERLPGIAEPEMTEGEARAMAGNR